MKKFFGVMFLIISVSIIGCKKSDDKKSSENGISPANAAETKKSKNDVPDIPFPKTLEELEKIKDKITPQQYENAKNSLKAVQNREKILFSNWNEDQINFYKATKDYKPGDKKLDSKLTELYKKIPLASRFRQAYPFPMPETNLCSGKNSNGEDYECGGVNARNKNNTMDYDQAPFTSHSFFSSHNMKIGEKKKFLLDAGKGGIIEVIPAIKVGQADLDKNKGLNFPNFISASLGGKNLEKMSPKVAAPQITASGIAGTWSMKKTFKTTQPSRMTGQYFKIPAGTEGEFEVSLALGEGADKFFKSSDYYVSFYEFGFTNLITYTEPKYVQTGNEIKFVAKFDKNSKPVKGFKIDKAFIFDFVKKTDIPLSFKEVSEGHFEATLTAPFKGREYVNLHPDNRIQYFIYASKKGKEASLHRQNVNHVYYHSTYCKVNGIKEWKYEKGKGLTISMDVDYMDKDKGSNYRSLIYLADKDGHQFAWGAYGPTKKVKLAANGKLYPSYFISDKALFWPGSFITEKDLVAGGIKVNARASLIKSNMKVISGNTCWNNTWMDLP